MYDYYYYFFFFIPFVYNFLYRAGRRQPCQRTEETEYNLYDTPVVPPKQKRGGKKTSAVLYMLRSTFTVLDGRS